MNIGKTGSSFSFGPRGARVTVGKNGVRKTVGIPGTGLSYSTYDRFGGEKSGTREKTAAKPQNNVDIGFFSSLFLNAGEKIFLDGAKALMVGNSSLALQKFSQIPDVADAAFMSAVLYLNTRQYQESAAAIEHGLKHSDELGKLFGKYNLNLDMTFPISDIFCVNLPPSLLAFNLLKVEILQHNHEIAPACALLVELYKGDPENLLVKISLAELILSSSNPGPWLKTLLAMTDHIENETPVHSVLLFYRGMVLKSLKLYDAAQTVLSVAGRRKKDRDPDFLLAIQEVRAEIYEQQGQRGNAKKMWEKIYAAYPTHPLALNKIQSFQ